MKARIRNGVVVLSVVMMLTGCQEMKQFSALLEPKPKQQAVAPAAQASSVQLGCDLTKLDSKVFTGAEYAWEDIAKACPASPVAAYNYGIKLMNAGETVKAAQVVSQAAQQHPNFAPLQELALRLNSPFTVVGNIADARLKSWLAQKSSSQFKLTPPQKSSPPPLPKLVKGEFEKKADFEVRVARAKSARVEQLRAIEEAYEADVARFNAAVASHNAAVEVERQERLDQIPARRALFLAEAMNEVFGDPKLVDPVYDSETERFHARLVSTKGLLNEKVTVAVPLAQGREFKEQIEHAVPVVPYTLQGDRLVRGAPVVQLGSRSYAAMFSDESFTPVVMTAVADAKVEAGKQIATMEVSKLNMSSVLQEDDAYFGAALSTQDDPKLAALRQQQAENERKLRQAQKEQALEAERNRVAEQIRLQQQQLAAMGGTASQEYEGLQEKRQWNFRHAQSPAREMVALVIGNRAYNKGIPLVHYAYNDAKAMEKFLVDGLGVPPENVLMREDATKGEMEGLFRRTLRNRVTQGKTDVLVYFSGHGMPADSEALLLPSDARPETADITGYSRDTMLSQLAALNAKSVTVVLDACFSGTAKDTTPLIQGKPVYKKPNGVKLPENVVLISASRANQISRMDKESGMSLMTMYLLEGLSGKADANDNNAVSVAELKQYLETEVSRAARLTFDAEQTPEVLGPDNKTLVVY